MGGLDVRYLTSFKGLNKASWFASVTTLSTPHRGSPLADIITGARQLTVADFGPLQVLRTPDYWVSFFKSLKKPSFSIKDLIVPGGLSQIHSQIREYITEAFSSPPDAFQNLTYPSYEPHYPNCRGPGIV
jgi:hypothetical protein